MKKIVPKLKKIPKNCNRFRRGCKQIKLFAPFTVIDPRYNMSRGSQLYLNALCPPTRLHNRGHFLFLVYVLVSIFCPLKGLRESEVNGLHNF